jgi:hypothetical protein
MMMNVEGWYLERIREMIVLLALIIKAGLYLAGYASTSYASWELAKERTSTKVGYLY